MVSAKDFLAIDFGGSDARVERQKKSFVQLLENLPKLTSQEKRSIVQEFVEVDSNRREKLINRVRAASILAHSSQHLEIAGDKAVAQKLVGVLRSEFLPIVIDGSDGTNNPRSLVLCNLDGLDLAFFRDVACAIYRVDSTEAERLFIELDPLVEESEIGNCLANLRKSKNLAGGNL